MVWFLFFFLGAPLYGEIVSVTVTWNTGMCNPGCVDLLRKKFEQMPQVKHVQMREGATILAWRPQSSFSYRSVKSPMQAVGVGDDTIRVQAAGKLEERNGRVLLRSSGDGTIFWLTSPNRAEPEAYTTKPNPYFRQLFPGRKEELLEFARKKLPVLVSGFLYQPGQSGTLQMIIETIKVEEKKK